MQTQSPKYEIRTLDDELFDWFVTTACKRMIYEEVGRPELYKEEDVRSTMSLLKQQGSGFVGLINGVPAGIIGGVLSPNFLNRDFTIYTEIVWYVLPEFRNTRIGAYLLFEFEKFGQENADETSIAILATSPISVRSLEKRGFMASEIAFKKIS